MENNDKVFLEQIQKRIQEGEFDDYLTMPFMNRNLLYNAVKSKINRRLAKGGTPMLTDTEIRESIEVAKETAGYTFHLFRESGILEKQEDGTYKLSRKGAIAMRSLSKY